MNTFEIIQQACSDLIQKMFSLSNADLKAITFTINTDESKQRFGDLTCNAPLVLAKKLQTNPKTLAQDLASHLTHEYIDHIEIAGPGFLNVFLMQKAFQQLAASLFEDTSETCRPRITEKKHFSLEFVSANPTGPLHLGHGRGGIIGDVLGNILRFVGHEVTKEYYINDAGSQIQKLGTSFKIRCQQELGIDSAMPEEGYKGEYLIQLAQECIAEYGKTILEKPDTFFDDYAKNHLLERIKSTLLEYGISFDVWFSEKTLHDNGAIEKALNILIKHGTTYIKDDALWFTSTAYGDDKDRVLRKANGELTYIAADVAYTQNKFNRADHLILVLGQDHHSYVVRLKGISAALGYNPDDLEVILYQLITLNEGGQQLRMSKRAGTMVTLKEVIELVGTDVARFFFLNRKADAHLDFDIELALKKTEENPVYYIQYAYVRTISILNKSHEHKELTALTSNDITGLGDEEKLLLKKIISLQELLLSMSVNYQTHLLTYYVLELAQLFHKYYSKNRVISLENIPQSRARLLLIAILKNTFELSLDLLGLSKPKKM
jgi:arginyl-tRNA synthetase